MPLQINSKHLLEHPLARMEYETETRSWTIGNEILKLTSLVNVEKSIDQVIEWLESSGHDPSEIEKLAPYFGAVWPSAVALCAYLSQPSVTSQMNDETLIELGCGLGIPAIICSKAGARCTAVDNHPSVPGFLNKNIEQNEPVNLIFESPDDILRRKQIPSQNFASQKYDWVIASDVLYDRALVAEFASMIDALAAEDGRCVVTDPGRAYIQEFVTQMNDLGWSEELVSWTVPPCPPVFQKDCDIYVLDFRKS